MTLIRQSLFKKDQQKLENRHCPGHGSVLCFLTIPSSPLNDTRMLSKWFQCREDICKIRVTLYRYSRRLRGHGDGVVGHRKVESAWINGCGVHDTACLATDMMLPTFLMTSLLLHGMFSLSSTR